MKKESHERLISLLVRVYNHTIQCYRYFPEVIICGSGKLEPEEFAALQHEGFVKTLGGDSFGSFYRLTEGAERWLKRYALRKRRRRLMRTATAQPQLPFVAAPCV